MAAVTGVGRADAMYERHSRRVFGYCLSRLGGREDAEDATQLTFLHAVRGLRGGVEPAAESAWLLAIARNVCLSRWASASRRSRVESVCDPIELERINLGSDPRRDELIGLEQALELLPEQQRRAVLLRDWRGLSYEEVAEQLGVSHAAVETLIFRGRAALAQHLEAQPAKGRRRVRSLGELAWLLDTIKGAFTGAAAGTKLAAAAAAVVAVSGGGIALGTSLTHDEPAPKPKSAQLAARTAARSTPALAVVSPATERAPVRSVPADEAATPLTQARGADPEAPAVATPAPPQAPTAPSPPAAGPVGAADAGPPVVQPATSDLEEPPVALPLPEASPELPALEVPPLPAGTLPGTDAVTAAVEPVTTVVDEIVAVAPPLPVPVPAPLPPAPGPKEIVPKEIVPTLP